MAGRGYSLPSDGGQRLAGTGTSGSVGSRRAARLVIQEPLPPCAEKARNDAAPPGTDGTLHSVSSRHVQRYVSEFELRNSQRKPSHRLEFEANQPPPEANRHASAKSVDNS